MTEESAVRAVRAARAAVACASDIVDTVRLGGLDVRSVLLHGSARLGGWVSGISDIDRLGVTTDPDPGPANLDAVGRAVGATLTGWPAPASRP